MTEQEGREKERAEILAFLKKAEQKLDSAETVADAFTAGVVASVYEAINLGKHLVKDDGAKR